MKLLGAKGGHARAAKLTAAQRSASARKAVRAREKLRKAARGGSMKAERLKADAARFYIESKLFPYENRV
jgi:hypothetical protein